VGAQLTRQRHVIGWAGGNIFHGAMGLNQLFFMRPSSGFARYQTPIPGLHYTPFFAASLCV
jgi:phytoene dehydrogenase-like protein